MSTTNEQGAYARARGTEQTPLPLPTPYDTFLLQHEEHMHQVLQDILNCSTEAIRRTNVHNMENVLSLFKGSSLYKKKEELVEFLKIMPEYKTNDQNLLYRRLKALKDQIKVTHGTSDLYLYASRKYRNLSASESDA